MAYSDSPVTVRRDTSHESRNAWPTKAHRHGAYANDDEDTFQDFMRAFGESDDCASQCDLVKEFCSSATLEGLFDEQVGQTSSIPRSTAWLLDSGVKEGKRRIFGPLTANQLYNELSRSHLSPLKTDVQSIRQLAPDKTKRLRSFYLQLVRPQYNLGTPMDQQGKMAMGEVHKSACRRTRRYFLALICKASYTQSFGLRTALYRHLAHDPYFEMAVTSEGHRIFQLAFHLPYYALRRSQEPHPDHRRGRNGEVLRRCMNLSLLDMGDHSPIFVYEADITVVVTGTSEQSWSAYCFSDTRFDGETEDRDHVELHKNVLEKEDPCSPHAIWKDWTDGCSDDYLHAREYFLCILGHRLALVFGEWNLVVEVLQQSICRREQHEIFQPLTLSSDRKYSVEEEVSCWRLHAWVAVVKEKVESFSEQLSATVEACEEFLLDYDRDFQEASTKCDKSHLEILKRTKELKRLKRTLECLEKRLIAFERKPGHQLKYKQIELWIQLQAITQASLTAKSARNSALVTSVFLALIISAVVFGMLSVAVPLLSELQMGMQKVFQTAMSLSFYPLGKQAYRLQVRLLECLDSSRIDSIPPLLASQRRKTYRNMENSADWVAEEKGLAFTPYDQGGHGDGEIGRLIQPSHSTLSEKDGSVEEEAAHGCSEDSEVLRHEPSTYDHLKIYFERLSGQQLVWWPFTEPDRPIADGMRRVASQCACGIMLPYDIPRYPHSIQSSTPRAWGTSPFGRADASRSSLPNGSPRAHGQNTGQTRSGSNQTDQLPRELTDFRSRTARPSPQASGEFIAFCIGHREDNAELVQLNALDHNDHTLVVTMLAEYTKIMGWFYLFWTMSTYPNVVSKLEARASHYIQCHNGAKWPWSRCQEWYPCCSPSTCKRLLRSIPKRLQARVEPGPNSVGYGMQAVTRIAVSKIIAVFVVWHTNPFCFAIYWLKHHPGDLQNATILLSLSLECSLRYCGDEFEWFRTLSAMALWGTHWDGA
ncbi:hypothetical protein EDD36DRAFT_414054 [Exophiala viscosa]|uniref:Uncharacterized protein n=1 Tax=Exophiala viscosa TaxID=2486360 RepID=A0AAN6E5D4_9EURO|nr:hypothetical protein EDD36DRAFT_414054 [Exophiala viscosa]